MIETRQSQHGKTSMLAQLETKTEESCAHLPGLVDIDLRGLMGGK